MTNNWMNVRHWFALGALLVAAAIVSVTALAQQYPSKPVRMVLPYPPGSGTDVLSRTVAQQLSVQLGQPVVVENRPGATGAIGIESVVRSGADGYVLLFSPNSPVTTSPHLNPVSFDVRKDLDPVALVANGNFLLVGHPSLPFRTLGDVIEYAKRHPGKLTFASGGSGSQSHMNFQMVKTGAGVDIVHVPYKGGGPAAIDLLAGHVHFLFESLPIMLPHVRAGKLRAFGVSTEKRNAFLPDVPPILETVKSFNIEIGNPWYGVFAPAGTPDAVLRKLNSELHKAVQNPDLQRRLPEGGFVAAPATTPAEFRKFLLANYERVGKFIASQGIKAQ